MRSHKESQSILRAALRAHGLRKHLRPRPSRSRVLPGNARYQDKIVLIRKRWLSKCYQIYPWYVSCSSLRSVLQSFWIQSRSDLNTVAKKASIVHTVTFLNCPSHKSCKKWTQNWQLKICKFANHAFFQQSLNLKSGICVSRAFRQALPRSLTVLTPLVSRKFHAIPIFSGKNPTILRWISSADFLRCIFPLMQLYHVVSGVWISNASKKTSKRSVDAFLLDFGYKPKIILLLRIHCHAQTCCLQIDWTHKMVM